MSARFHRPELDCLRFGAFFLVFLHHALPHASTGYPFGGPLAQSLAALARAGALGVDLFFALSAYLITELLLREHAATGSLNIRAFYTRRVLRIWPLYYVALLVLAPAMAYLRSGDSLPAAYVAGFALLSGNWVCAIAGYPASSFALLWSVSIEEQFYLVWPWLVRGNVRRIGTVAVTMLAIASLTRIALAATGTIHPGVWCNTLARLDPIAGGALLALKASTPRRWLGTLGLAGLLVIGGFAGHSGWITLATYPLTAACAVDILQGVLDAGWGRRFRLPAYLGKISFGLYVFHAAVIELAGPWLALPLTIAVAALSYRFLETPFLRLKDRRSWGHALT